MTRSSAKWRRSGLLALVVVATAGAAEPAVARPSSASSLRAALAAERARQPPPRIEREAFLERSPVRRLRLSPDGRFVALLKAEKGAAAPELWLLPTDGKAERRLLARTGAVDLHWSADAKWIFLEEPERVSRLDVASLASSRQLFTLGGEEHRTLLAIDHSRPASLLVTEKGPAANASAVPTYRLLRLDAEGRSETLHESASPIADAVLDDRGELAFLRLRDGDGYRLVRREPSGAVRTVARCDGLATCRLVATTPDGQGAWLRGNLGGDLARLARLDPSGAIRGVHQDPRGEADLDELVLDPRSGQPFAAIYRSVVPSIHGLTDESRRAIAILERRFAGRGLRLEIGRGPGARWLVEESSDLAPFRRWHLFDPDSGATQAIGGPTFGRTSAIAEGSLARRIPFTYDASDGRRLHAFLSVPPGADPTGLPLVARVHGGPWNHAASGYDPIVQFLVQRGCAVFEPNFRGSTGHGRDYMLAAQGDFGAGRVQRDIEEGVRLLLRSGVGDAKRVGILGASFGGYSALLGVTFSPELFRVGVAVVPPPDFGWAARYMAEREGQGDPAAMPLTTSLRLLGLDPADNAVAARLRRESPAENAARLSRPLLLLAGGEDDRVALRSVLDYAARLEAMGKEVTLYVAKDQGHEIDDPLHREAFLALVEELFHRELGTAAPSAIHGALRDELNRNLRLGGERIVGVAR